MNPYSFLGVLLAWLLSLCAVGYWQHNDGQAMERAKWQAREVTELRTANDKIAVLEHAARSAELDYADAMNKIAIQFEQEKRDANIKTNRLIAKLRAGDLRLYDPAARRESPCAGTTGETPASPGSGDGATAGGLSGEATEFLLSEAERADEIVLQLNACQGVVRADRLPHD